MAIPTEEEFRQAIEAYTFQLPDDSLKKFKFQHFRSPNDPAGHALVKEAAQLYMEMLDAAGRTAAAVWFRSDRSVIRAWTSIKRSTRDHDLDGMASLVQSLIAGWVSESMRDYFPTDDAIPRYWLQTEFDGLVAYHSWTVGMLMALHEYFYRKDAVSDILKQLKKLAKLEQALDAAQQAITELNAIADSVTWRSTTRQQPENLLRSIEIAQRIKRTKFPFKRVDATSPERLLIYRLWEIHLMVVGRPHISAIDTALSIEGIENQMDRRTIERICSSFGHPRFRSFPHRELMRRGRLLTAGVPGVYA